MRVVSWSLTAPTLSIEVINHAKALSREKALGFEADRLAILTSCAVECEQWIGRMLWPGARAARAIVRVSDTTEDVSLLPRLPDTTGVTLGTPAVLVWGRRRRGLGHSDLQETSGRARARAIVRRVRHQHRGRGV